MLLLPFLFIFLILLLLVLNALYKRTNNFRNQFYDVNKFLLPNISTNNPPFDIINLGSNHPKYAIDYSESKDVNGMNWAVGPQTFEFDFLILKKYYKFIHNNGVVLIPVCPLKFFLDKYKNTNSLTKYYLIFNEKEIPHYSIKHMISNLKFPLIFHPSLIKYLLRDTIVSKRLSLEINPMNKFQLIKDSEHWIKECWNLEFDIDIQNMGELSILNKKAIKYNIIVLKKIFTFCINKGLKPVIVYLPVTQYLYNQFPDGFFNDFVKRFVNIASEGNPIPVLDYINDGRFNKENFFINSFFMNRTGAKIITRQIITDLKQNKILE